MTEHTHEPRPEDIVTWVSDTGPTAWATKHSERLVKYSDDGFLLKKNSTSKGLRYSVADAMRWLVEG